MLCSLGVLVVTVGSGHLILNLVCFSYDLRLGDVIQNSKLSPVTRDVFKNSIFCDNNICRDSDTQNNAGMMCASSKEGNDSCSGDSGRPLLLTPNNNYADDLLVGTISWGIGCGDSRYPGVYTRISRHYDWIVETMCTISPDSAPEYCNPVGKEADICRAKGGACHKSDKCCSGRCDFFSNTCFAEIEKSEQRRGRGSTGMGGAAGGSALARGSRSNINTDAIRGIARDLPWANCNVPIPMSKMSHVICYIWTKQIIVIFLFSTIDHNMCLVLRISE